MEEPAYAKQTRALIRVAPPRWRVTLRFRWSSIIAARRWCYQVGALQQDTHQQLYVYAYICVYSFHTEPIQ